jgi:hypothetical protein
LNPERGKALNDTFVRQPSIVFPIPFLMVDRYRYESWNRSFSNDTPQLSREQIGPCHRRLLGHNRVSVSRIAHAMHGRMGNDAIDRQWLQIKKIAAKKNWIAPFRRRPMSFKHTRMVDSAEQRGVIGQMTHARSAAEQLHF